MDHGEPEHHRNGAVNPKRDNVRIEKGKRYETIWIFTDGKLLQARLVENGLAEVAYLYGDYKYTEKLQKLQKQAQNNKVGIWSDYQDTSNIYIIIGTIIFIVILCIFNKQIRKKVITKGKRKINKELNKQIDKIFK